MKLFRNLVISVCLAGAGLAAMELTGCSNGSWPAAPPPAPPPAPPGTTINGTVQAPGGILARADPDRQRWWAALLPAEAYAQVSGLTFVQSGKIFVFQIDDQGNPVGSVLATSAITATVKPNGKVNASYTVTLPVGVPLGPHLIVQAAPLNNTGPTPVCDPATPGCQALGVTLNRQAIDTRTDKTQALPLDVTPLSEALMRSILKRIAATHGSLDDLTNEEITQLTNVINAGVGANPSLLIGTTPTVVNNIVSSLSALIGSALNVIGGPGSSVAPTILTMSLPNGVIEQSYGVTLLAVGGTGGLTWGLDPDSGPLPTGISLGTSGTLGGRPTGTGTTLLKVGVVAGDNLEHPALQPLSLTINPSGAASDFPVTVGTGLTPDYSWPGIALLHISVSRTSAPLLAAWYVIAGRTDVNPPVTQGTVPQDATALSSTETTLTAGVEYQVSIVRADGKVGFATFIPQAPPPLPNGSGPGYVLAFVGHGTETTQNTLMSIGPAIRQPKMTTFDSAKHMIAFEDAGTETTIGTMIVDDFNVDDFSADARISIGRWNSGTSGGTYQTAPTFTCTPSQGLHYVVGKPGTPSAGMPATGVFTYIPIKTTTPTYNDGIPSITGTNALSGTINAPDGAIKVDFASKKVGLDLTIKMPDRNVPLKTKGGIDKPDQSEISFSDPGTVQTFEGTFDRFTVGGFFVGAAAERVGLIIRWTRTDSNQVDVAAMYKR